MTPRLDMVGLAARDLRASLAFYRRLGLDIPEGAENEPHVEATLPGGVRIAWDTYEVMQSFDPGWSRLRAAAYDSPSRRRSRSSSEVQ